MQSLSTASVNAEPMSAAKQGLLHQLWHAKYAIQISGTDMAWSGLVKVSTQKQANWRFYESFKGELQATINNSSKKQIPMPDVIAQ